VTDDQPTKTTVHIAPTADQFLAFIGAIDEALRRLEDTTERLVEARTALGGTSQEVQRFYEAVDRASDHLDAIAKAFIDAKGLLSAHVVKKGGA
jgi:flavin-binding protein dodecin